MSLSLHRQNCSITTSITLSDELHDLTAKYESLAQKYKTVQLQNDQYKHHIAMIQRQNDDLKREISSYQNSLHDMRYFKPILDLHASTIQTELSENDEQIQELTEKLEIYERSISLLKSENISIKSKNKKFQIALENMNKQKRIYNDTLQDNNNYINSLKYEIQSLQDEITMLKAMELPLVSNNSATSGIGNTPIPEIGIFPSNGTTFKVMKSIIMEETDSHSFGFEMPLSERSESIQFINNSSIKLHEIEDIKIKLQSLERGNAELKQKLKTLNMNEIDQENQDDDDDEQWNEFDIFDEDEIDEMERLFKKCDDEISNHEYSHGFMQKYTKWLSQFENIPLHK